VPVSTDPVPGIGTTVAAAGAGTGAAAGATASTDVVMEPEVAAAAGTASGPRDARQQAPTAEDVEEWLQRPRKAQVSMGGMSWLF
jgi:hypothetical protein